MTRMTDGSMGPPAIDAVLAALERLVTDLRRRTENAERRAAEADERATRECQARQAETAARHEAEIRAAVAEQSATDAAQRAEAAEAAAGERAEQMHRELLTAAWKAVEAAQDAAAGLQATRLDRHHVAETETSDPRPGHEPTRATRPTSSGTHGPSRSPLPHRRDEDAGYAWTEDDPGPSWWHRILGRRRY
jgi:hypothetical protein